MGKSGAGRRNLKRYELTNLFFFLGLIAVLAVLLGAVFWFYAREDVLPEQGEQGIVSEAFYPGSDIGMFRLGTKIFQTSRQYQNSLQIPVTDDGFLRDLFEIPGVEEVTVDQKSIMIRKETSASWDDIRPRLQEVIKSHLHLHY